MARRKDSFDEVAERFLKHRDWNTQDGKELLREMRRRLESMCYGIGPSPDRASEPKDLAQEVSRRFVRALPRFRGTTGPELKGWMRRVLERLAQDIAKAQRRGADDDPTEAGGDSDPHLQAEVLEIMEMLGRENSRWPKVISADMEGKTGREAAEELGVSVHNFDQIKHRARARFREIFEERHGL